MKQTPNFWTQEVAVWDSYHNVGARSNYVTCTYAAPLLKRTALAHQGSFTPLIVSVVAPPPSTGEQYLNVAHRMGEACKRELVSFQDAKQVVPLAVFGRPPR